MSSRASALVTRAICRRTCCSGARICRAAMARLISRRTVATLIPRAFAICSWVYPSASASKQASRISNFAARRLRRLARACSAAEGVSVMIVLLAIRRPMKITVAVILIYRNILFADKLSPLKYRIKIECSQRRAVASDSPKASRGSVNLAFYGDEPRAARLRRLAHGRMGDHAFDRNRQDAHSSRAIERRGSILTRLHQLALIFAIFGVCERAK